MKNHRFTILLITLLCLIAPAAFADEGNLYKVPLEEKVTASTLIVSGKVLSSESYWDAAGDMIYTQHTVRVYSVFKGLVSSETIQVRTVGGRVGNDMVTTSSLLTLSPGEEGVFFCAPPAAPGGGYEVYASKQGFIRFSGGRAVCPFYSSDLPSFNNALSVLTNVNNSLLPGTGTLPSPAALTTNVTFTPSIITAGTNSLLTITGSGFGTSGPDAQNYVAFSNANNGGNGFLIPLANSYISWTNTEIVLEVPTDAGTGPMRLIIGGTEYTTSATLTIPFSILNAGTHDIPRHTNTNGSGGMTWTFCNNMNLTGGAAAPFNRAISTWKCATGINWTVASGSVILDDASSTDGINLVARNTVDVGVLGVCYSYYNSCDGGLNWRVTGNDIIFREYFLSGEGSWNYNISPPAFSSYDFESVALHELGHAHQLGHVIDTDNVMHYALTNGEMLRTLSVENIMAGNFMMNISTATPGICSQTPMTYAFPAGCAQLSSTDAWLSGPNQPLSSQTCFGTSPVQASFANYGTDPITQIVFGWSVNGIVQPTITWNGNLAFTQGIDDFTVGSFNFQDSLYEVLVWASTVNGMQEINQLNDTVTYLFHPKPCTPNNVGPVAFGTVNLSDCGPDAITADVVNFGTNNITAFDIVFYANGLAVDNMHWTGLLPPGDTLHNLYVTTYDLHPVTHAQLRTVLPNGVTDTYAPNDTVSHTYFPTRLLGTYTIGGTAPDFATVQSALVHLDTYGVCGDVTFDIRPGTYPTVINLDSIPADNMLYTIVFQSESGNAADVNITQPTAGNVFYLARAHNLEFRNLSFSSTTIWGLYMRNGSKNMYWHDNIFNSARIIIESNQNNRTCDNARIANNRFLNSGSVIAQTTSSMTALSNGIVVSGNTFGFPGTTGQIALEGYKNIRISDNRINYGANSTYEPIHLYYYNDSLNIYNNVIRKTAGGSLNAITVDSQSGTSETAPVRIFNNSISMTTGTAAIYVRGVEEAEIYFNSVYVWGASPTNTIKVLNLQYNDTSRVFNNQLVTTGMGSIITFDDDNYLFSCDYNNYLTNGNFAQSLATTYPTLANFAMSYNSDAHSTSTNPQFISSDSLVPMNTVALENLGTPIGYITRDLPGNMRHPVTPDVGAYEFQSYPNDIAAQGYNNLSTVTLCEGSSSDLYLGAYNNGTTTITSFYVYLSMNGVPVDTVLINTSIAPQQSVQFLVGNYTFNDPITNIQAVFSQPNNANDPLGANNTYSFTFLAQLSGEYTVGAAPSDFPTIQQALQSLSQGICGPVTFNLKDGFHDNWGTLSGVPGSSAVNTITFQSLSHDTAAVKISSTGWPNELTIENVPHLTFRHLQFGTHGTFTEAAISLDSVTTLVIDSCRFYNGQLSVHETTGSGSITHTGFTRSVASMDESSYLSLTDNVFDGPTTYLRVYDCFNTLVSRNNFTIPSSSQQSGIIQIGSSQQFEVSYNRVFSSTLPLSINGAVSGAEIVKNNFFVTNSGGARFSANTGLKVVHNTFRMGELIYLMADNVDMDFLNNIVYNTGTNPTFRFNDATEIQDFNADYNVYYGNQSSFVYDPPNTYLPYYVWRQQYLRDQHSLTGDPNFVSATDLHINSLGADSSGIALSYVTDDIDGEPRNATHPDIGADEFDFNTSATFDVALGQVLEPQNGLCYADDSLVVTLINNHDTVLTSVHFTYNITSTTLQYNWTGSLAPGETDTVTLYAGTYIPGWNYNMHIGISLPNGETDWYTTNNDLTFLYSAYEPVELTSTQDFLCGTQTLVIGTSVTNNDLTWSTGSTNDTIHITAGGNYWVDAVNANGCFSSDTIAITSYPAAVPVLIQATGDTTFCFGDNVLLTANPQLPGNTYAWTWNNATTPSVTVGGSATVMLTTTDTNGCISTDSQVVTQYSVPNATISVVNSMTLQNNSPGAVSWQWILNGLPIPGGTGQTLTVSQDGSYSVVVWNAFGCVDTSAIMYFDYSGVGLEEQALSGISIAPNPASDHIVVRLDRPADLELLMSNGQLVRRIEDAEEEQVISLEGLSSGIYLLRATTAERTVLVKIVKE